MATPRDLLETPLRFLKGVGPRRAADLEHAGLTTVEDLLSRFPVRYDDRGQYQLISAVKPGAVATIAGEVLGCGLRSTRRPGFKIFEALVRDASGSIRAVWLNQPYLRDVFEPHQRVVLFGTVEFRKGLQLTNPQYEMLRSTDEGEASGDDETIHTWPHRADL